MRILFIKPKQIGDSLILTPTLVAVRQAYPDAEIWVMVRRGCEKILAGCPEINHILTLAGVDKSERTPVDFLRQVAILFRLWSVRFDYVFELGDGHRARLFARAARTRRRYSVKPSTPLKERVRRRFTGVSVFDWKTCHRVEKDFFSVAEFLPLPEPPRPLRFDRGLTRRWTPAESFADFVVMQVGTRQGFNRWTREGWRDVGAHLLTRVENLVITSGSAPNEIEEADWLRAELGPRAFCTRGEADWAQVAGLLYRARLYVGPATAAMHLAAACACPVVAFFGPTIEDHWHPWRVPYRIVTSDDVAGIADPEERYRRVKQRSILDTAPARVIAACDDLLAIPRTNALS
jgi:heptosyltransferase-3